MSRVNYSKIDVKNYDKIIKSTANVKRTSGLRKHVAIDEETPSNGQT
jgi:hypothetical protein